MKRYRGKKVNRLYNNFDKILNVLEKNYETGWLEKDKVLYYIDVPHNICGDCCGFYEDDIIWVIFYKTPKGFIKRLEEDKYEKRLPVEKWWKKNKKNIVDYY